AAEFEPLHLFALMNGGPFNPLVTQIFFDPYDLSLFNTATQTYLVDAQDILQPTLWNWYYVEVYNQTATGLVAGPGSWQRITIQ
ncbi:MAG: hypothetical protein KC933_22010, partial [Myxococcales bacterium]|nr:hypothetical protein [Myxococcales bacterium]